MVKYYKCSHCGNLVEMAVDSGVVPVCCGEPMKELRANTTDGAAEKHVPVVNVNGNQVEVLVGSVTHPMLPEHHIVFIALETNQGVQRKTLDPAGEPRAVFALALGEQPVAAYEFCNLHGLWKKEI